MKHAIDTLRRTAETTGHNAAIHRAEGRDGQADLDDAVAADCREAITLLSPQPCTCWADMNEKLAEKGFRLSPVLSAISVGRTDLDLSVSRHLPLVRTDGFKLKRSDPQNVAISHCPWCGMKLDPSTDH